MNFNLALVVFIASSDYIWMKNFFDLKGCFYFCHNPEVPNDKFQKIYLYV